MRDAFTFSTASTFQKFTNTALMRNIIVVPILSRVLLKAAFLQKSLVGPKCNAMLLLSPSLWYRLVPTAIRFIAARYDNSIYSERKIYSTFSCSSHREKDVSEIRDEKIKFCRKCHYAILSPLELERERRQLQ